jgi:uncharacterized coiled-coil DUF342 family protein
MEEKIDNLNKNVDTIKELLQSLTIMIGETNERVDLLDKKIDKITTKLDGDIISECKKMGSHIDFVESVYDSVKKPLNYVCNKIDYLTDYSQEQPRITGNM